MRIFRTKLLFLLVSTMLIGTMSFAQSIHFNYTDNTNASYNLEDVRKITFSSDIMNLHFWDGSVYSWNVNTIGYYQYDESSVNVQEWINNANSWELMVFPNPLSSKLNVQYNLPKEDEITTVLFDTNGKLFLQKNLGKQASGEHQETIELTSIPPGTYLCQISGNQNSITKTVVKN